MKVAFDKIVETFVVYVVVLKIETLINLVQIAQIAILQQDKAFIKVLAKYADYVDVFSFDLVIELLKNTGINNYAIK